MNFYDIQVNQPSNTIRNWLKKNGGPKAAKTVQDTATGCRFTMEGNVSAIIYQGHLQRQGWKVDISPIDGSQELKNVISIEVF